MHPLGAQGQRRPTSAETQPSKVSPLLGAETRAAVRTGSELARFPNQVGSDGSFLLMGPSPPKVLLSLGLSRFRGERPNSLPGWTPGSAPQSTSLLPSSGCTDIFGVNGWSESLLLGTCCPRTR